MACDFSAWVVLTLIACASVRTCQCLSKQLKLLADLEAGLERGEVPPSVCG